MNKIKDSKDSRNAFFAVLFFTENKIAYSLNRNLVTETPETDGDVDSVLIRAVNVSLNKFKGK